MKVLSFKKIIIFGLLNLKLIFLKLNYILIYTKNGLNILFGIGDWGLGIGDWGLGPIPNPQSPIPNQQLNKYFINNLFLNFIIELFFIENENIFYLN